MMCMSATARQERSSPPARSSCGRGENEPYGHYGTHRNSSWQPEHWLLYSTCAHTQHSVFTFTPVKPPKGREGMDQPPDPSPTLPVVTGMWSASRPPCMLNCWAACAWAAPSLTVSSSQAYPTEGKLIAWPRTSSGTARSPRFSLCGALA